MKKKYIITDVKNFVAEVLDIIEDDMDYYLGSHREELETKLLSEIIEDTNNENWEGRIGTIKRK